MTMHMLPAYYTTTSLKKKKAGKRTAALIKATADHEKYLRKMGVHADQIQARSSVRLELTAHNGVVAGSNPAGPTTDQIPVGVAAKSEPKIYNGKRKLLGIATMHKSCLVPVFGKDQALEIARMRRG